MENADLLVHVVDRSDCDYREHMQTTKELLEQMHTSDLPMLTVYNKADRCEQGVEYPKLVGGDKLYLSAKEASSIELLVQTILDRIYEDYVQAEFLIPYTDGEVVSYFMEQSEVLESAYEENGTRIRVKCHKADRDKYKAYAVA